MAMTMEELDRIERFKDEKHRWYRSLRAAEREAMQRALLRSVDVVEYLPFPEAHLSPETDAKVEG